MELNFYPYSPSSPLIVSDERLRAPDAPGDAQSRSLPDLLYRVAIAEIKYTLKQIIEVSPKGSLERRTALSLMGYLSQNPNDDPVRCLAQCLMEVRPKNAPLWQVIAHWVAIMS